MAQIKLSIAFVLAVVAIAPIVAQPVGESHEFAENIEHRPHHRHHHHHRHHQHHHQRVASPEQSSLEPKYDTEKVAREYPEIDEMFERADNEEGESRPNIFPLLNGPSRLGGIGPQFRKRPSRPQVPVHPFHRHGGHRPVRRPFDGQRHGSATRGPGVLPREYPELEDVFERDFEDVEFDARDFDDELYLD